MIAAAVLALVFAAPAAAQEAGSSSDALRACVAEAERDPEAERACVGVQALACVDAGADAATCHAAETAGWEAALEALRSEVAALMRLDAGVDGPVPGEGLLDGAEAAWAAFRDADCALAAAHWDEDAEMRARAGAQCRMERTAARALELTALRRAYESP